jgi:hypothetical protein
MLHVPFALWKKLSRPVKIAASLAHQWKTKIFTKQEQF